MVTINLDSQFSPLGGEFVGLETFMFPSKMELHVKLNTKISQKVFLTTRIKSSDDIMTLLLATDACRRAGAKEIFLFIPFVPYARQDRVMVQGEPLSIKVFSDLINLQNYSRVYVFDPHSDVCVSLINNVEVISNHSFVEQVVSDKTGYVIVSPDAGAYKKIFKVCQHIDYQGDIVICNKIRDLSNGNIKKISIDSDDLCGKDVFIVDDICDGGATFKFLAKELKDRNAGTVNLIISHGIFSNGEDFLIEGGIDSVYTTNSIKDIDSTYINQIKLNTSILGIKVGNSK